MTSGHAHSLPLLQQLTEVIRLPVMMHVRVAQRPGPALAHDYLGNSLGNRSSGTGDGLYLLRGTLTKTMPWSASNRRH